MKHIFLAFLCGLCVTYNIYGCAVILGFWCLDEILKYNHKRNARRTKTRI